MLLYELEVYNMETYDFRQETEYINKMRARIDELSEREVKQVTEYIDKIRENSNQEQISQSLEWFDVAVLPALQEFSEMTSSLLTIEKNDRPIVVATLSNRHGFDITENCRLIRMFLGLAHHIGINNEDNLTSLVLIFDCARLGR